MCSFLDRFIIRSFSPVTTIGGGKIFDIYGSYENAWWISVTLGIIAFLFHIFIQEKSFNYVPKMNLVKT